MNKNPKKRSAPTAQPVEGKKGRHTVVSDVADIIKAYSSVAADPAISLPEVTVHIRDEEPTASYPPLIVDGASGAGKTQQFFLLLRNGFPGAYLLPRSMKRGQKIYQQMESFTKMNGLRHVLEESFAALKKETEEKKTEYPDPFSIVTIRSFIKHSQVFVPAIDALASAIHKSDAGSEIGLARVEQPRNGRSFLKGKVLFIDEVLSGSSLDSKFLRFLRNLGRELGMRCVLAGTSATAANMSATAANMPATAASMICETHKGQGGSRSSEQSDVVWAVVCFLWRKSSPTGAQHKTEKSGSDDGEDGPADVASVGAGAQPKLEEHAVGAGAQPKLEKSGGDSEDGEPGVLKQSVLKCLSDGRPLVEKIAKNYLQHSHPDVLKKSQQNMTKQQVVGLIRDVAASIQTTKQGSEGWAAASLSWAMGSWLDGEEKSHHPFRMRSASLVKKHFFEPAIRVVKEDNSDKAKPKSKPAVGGDGGSEKGADKKHKAFTGWGLGTLERQSSPCYINIMRAQAQPSELPWWLISTTDKPVSTIPLKEDHEETLAICRNFKGVEYALTSCVQQCLAREPVLALSLMGTLDGLHTKDDSFIKAVSESLQEERYCTSSSQGPLNERLCMAALVVVSAKLGFYSPDLCTKAQQFTEALIDIMNPGHADFIPHTTFRTVSKKQRPDHKKGKISPQFYVCHETTEENSTAKYAAVAKQDDENKKQKPALDFVKADGEELQSLARDFADADMPLLVPACSKDRLTKSVALYPGLFQGLEVAGLVPGLVNSRLDLSAHLLSDPEPAAWMFELRSCSNGYAVSQAARDLTEKVRGSKESCHAMLIGLKGEGPSDCWVWKNEKGKLNVAMVLVFPAY